MVDDSLNEPKASMNSGLISFHPNDDRYNAFRLCSLMIVILLVLSFFVLIYSDESDALPDDSGICGDGVEYYYSGSTKTLTISYTSGTGVMTDYEAKEFPWYGYYGEITSLIIGDGVTSIGSHAFDGCCLIVGDLTIPDSVKTIGSSAFNGCFGFIGDLKIPNSVTIIGDWAFSRCAGFTGLTLGDHIETIGDCAFLYCSNFTGNLILPDSILSIGASAFDNCSKFTGDLIIPNSVKSIGDSAFFMCSGFTGSLILPNSLTSIGRMAFKDCHGFTGNLIIPSSVTAVGWEAFSGCRGFTGELVIGDGVTSIGSKAFWGCSGFTGNLNIPNSVTIVDRDTFMYCRGFNGNLNIPNSVTTIGENAFADCSGLIGSLTIPNSVKSIGSGAFFNCSGFTGSLTIPNSVTSIGEGAFEGCYNLSGKLVIPNSITSIAPGTFWDCEGFTGDLIIPDSVTSIGERAFNHCTGFSGNLIIPDSVTSIGERAFYQCGRLSGALTIGNNVSSIGKEAFFECPRLTAISLPNRSYSESVNSCFSAVFHHDGIIMDSPTWNDVMGKVWIGSGNNDFFNGYVTVILDPNNGSSKLTKIVIYGETYGDLPIPTSSANFLGWFTHPSGGSEVTSDFPVLLTDSQILYAQWGESPGPTPVDKYTVSFSTGKGGNVTPSSVQVESGSIISVSGNVMTIGSSKIIATHDDFYSFDHWSINSGTVLSDMTISVIFEDLFPTSLKVYVENGSALIVPSVIADLDIDDESKLVLNIDRVQPKLSNIPSDAVCFNVGLKYDGKVLISLPSEIELIMKFTPLPEIHTYELNVFYVSDDGTVVKDKYGGYNTGDKGAKFVTDLLGMFVVTDKPIEPLPALSSISIKNAPAILSYSEGDLFNPQGLAINLHYVDGSSQSLEYKGNESMISFSPSIITPLKSSDKSILITYQGKSVSQTITVTGSSTGDVTSVLLYVAIIVIVLLLIIIVVLLLRRKTA